MKAKGKRQLGQPAFFRDEGETAAGCMQAISCTSLLLGVFLAFGAIGLGCGRQQAKRTSSKGESTGESGTSPSWQQAKPTGLAGPSALGTTPTPSKEQPLDLREALTSPNIQQARKTRKEIEGFRRKFIKGFKLPFPSDTKPLLLAADAVLLPETAEVLGISTNGVSRAYLVVGMWEPLNHVVHDNLAGQPITITYCDVNDCAYAYQRKDIAPKDFHVSGWDGQNMLLLIQGKHYAHPTVPLPAHPIKRTTWGEWKALHPDTKIYLGSNPGQPKDRK